MRCLNGIFSLRKSSIKASESTNQSPNGALSSTKCSIKAPPKCKISIYVLKEICLTIAPLKYYLNLFADMATDIILLSSWMMDLLINLIPLKTLKKKPRRYSGRIQCWIIETESHIQCIFICF